VFGLSEVLQKQRSNPRGLRYQEEENLSWTA
jgi:hypothetical protein